LISSREKDIGLRKDVLFLKYFYIFEEQVSFKIGYNNGENKNYSNPLRFNTLDSFKILLIKYGDIKYKKNLLYL